MDLLELVDQVDSDIEKKMAERQEILLRADELTREVADLKNARAALERLAHRYASRDVAEQVDQHAGGASAASPAAANEWLELQRTEAVERVLREAGRPLALAAIASTLAEHGRREDSVRYVSAALSHLRRKVGTAQNLGRGVWTYVDPSNFPNGSADVGADDFDLLTAPEVAERVDTFPRSSGSFDELPEPPSARHSFIEIYRGPGLGTQSSPPAGPD